MRILAIETSCDETAAAVVTDGHTIESNIVHSQIKAHKKFGGVVPELASRMHAEIINKIITLSLKKAKVTFKDLDAIAVTQGPGLEGALLIGQTAAKTLAKALNIPLIPVHHIHGHIYSSFLPTPPENNENGCTQVVSKEMRLDISHERSLSRSGGLSRSGINDCSENIQDRSFGATPPFPFLSLIVSGGHTQLVHAKDHFDFEIISQTRDDAVGECFDKVARTLGLSYPGGPAIQEAAIGGNPKAFPLPKPMSKNGYEFSFSGLKTAVIQTIKPLTLTPQIVQDIAASFQQTVVDILVQKTLLAAKTLNITTITLAGGVSANTALRTAFQQLAPTHNLTVIIPPMIYTTDNAAMIATAAHYQCQYCPNTSPIFAATPNLPLSHPK